MSTTLQRSTTPPDGFETVTSAPQFEGPLFTVRRDTLRLPGGERSDFDVAHHPGSVAVVALDDSGRVLLVRQWRPATGAAEWEIPAGLRDEEGESARATAERELGEEAGVGAPDWQHLLTLHTSPGFTDERCEIFLATGAHRTGEPDREPAEASIRSRWVPLEEAVEAVLAGDLTTGPTVAGVLAAVRSCGRR